MTCKNPTKPPLFSPLLAASSKNHVDFHGWSPQSPRDRAGQRELCSLKTEPWDCWDEYWMEEFQPGHELQEKRLLPSTGIIQEYGAHHLRLLGKDSNNCLYDTNTHKKNPSWCFGLGQNPRIVSEMALTACRRSTRCRFLMALLPFPLSGAGLCWDFLPLTF